MPRRESERMVQVSIRLPPALRDRLLDQAARDRRSLSNHILFLLDQAAGHDAGDAA